MTSDKAVPLLITAVQLPHGTGLPLPIRQSIGSAGLDLLAAIDPAAPFILPPRARVVVPTGLSLAIPLGYEGQVRPRSGIARAHGVTVLNSPGTIDADYRGEVKVLLINLGDAPFEIRRGDRIAQLVILPVTAAAMVAVVELDETQRGTEGFGSTGVALALPSEAPKPKPPRKKTRSGQSK